MAREMIMASETVQKANTALTRNEPMKRMSNLISSSKFARPT